MSSLLTTLTIPSCWRLLQRCLRLRLHLVCRCVSVCLDWTLQKRDPRPQISLFFSRPLEFLSMCRTCMLSWVWKFCATPRRDVMSSWRRLHAFWILDVWGNKKLSDLQLASGQVCGRVAKSALSIVVDCACHRNSPKLDEHTRMPSSLHRQLLPMGKPRELKPSC